MLSFWEKQSYLDYDYAVIGAGITGLSTAISLMERSSQSKVVVIERSVIPTGASTKNAGFACFGSLTELLADVEAMGEEAMLSLVESRWQGLELLRARLGDRTIDLQVKGGYELISSHNVGCVGQLHHVNDLLSTYFNTPVFELKDELIHSFGFNISQVSHLIYNQFEGQLDTGRMMRTLQAKAQECGVEIILNTKVEHIENSRIQISQEHGHNLEIKADQVAICTNAFTKALMPQLELNPGRGLVLVTKPLTDLPFEGTFHMNQGYDYFRDYYGRIIYGGCRDIVFEEEATDQFGINQKILDQLQHRLKNIILGHDRFEIDHVWSGIMAFGEDKRPVVKRIDQHTVAGVRLGGMGVALGSLIGQQLAEMMLKPQ